MMENAIKLFAAIGIAASMIAAVLHEYQELTTGKKQVKDYLPDPKVIKSNPESEKTV